MIEVVIKITRWRFMDSINWGLFFGIFLGVMTVLFAFYVLTRIFKIVHCKNYIRKRIIYCYIKFKGDNAKILEWFNNLTNITNKELKRVLKGVNLKDYVTPFDKDFFEQITLQRKSIETTLCLERLNKRK
jgi:hypothetical protein